MSDYVQQRREAIRKFLGGDEFILAGTRAWYGNGVQIGQTLKHCVTTVYNKKIEGVYRIDGVTERCRFFKESFPLTPSREFWVVDILNNIMGLDITESEAITNIRIRIHENVFNVETLLQECKRYGKEPAKTILAQVLAS
jgi:hypothetical protein